MKRAAIIYKSVNMDFTSPPRAEAFSPACRAFHSLSSRVCARGCDVMHSTATPITRGCRGSFVRRGASRPGGLVRVEGAPRRFFLFFYFSFSFFFLFFAAGHIRRHQQCLSLRVKIHARAAKRWSRHFVVVLREISVFSRENIKTKKDAADIIYFSQLLSSLLYITWFSYINI